MAITKIDFPTASTPSYTPSISTDYNAQNDNIEQSAKGYIAVTLNNWDSSSLVPEIASGSCIESNGSFWVASTNTSISTSGASVGILYLYFDDTTPEYIFSNTAPSWSAPLNGWYNSGSRFTGHSLLWDGNSVYSIKSSYSKNAQDGGILKILASGGSVLNNIITEWTYVIGESFASPAGDISGVVYDGTNLISCDRTTGLIYIHDGVSASVSSSFAAPGGAPTGVAFDGVNLLSCDGTAGRIYIHSGITSTVSSSFLASGSFVNDITFDGTNLISSSGSIYVHVGITAATSATISTSSSGVTGVAYDGVNLISCNNATDKIYIRDGISANILVTINAPSSTPFGLGLIGSNLVSCANSSNRIYIHGTYA